jgi:hypothetical protein
MTSAADLMHPGAHWIPATQTLNRAAQLIRELNIGTLPVSDPWTRWTAASKTPRAP